MNQVILHRRAADRVNRLRAIKLNVGLIEAVQSQIANPNSKTAPKIVLGRAERLAEALAEVIEAKDVAGIE